MTEIKADSNNENIRWGLGDAAIGYAMSLALPLWISTVVVTIGYSNESDDLLPFGLLVLGMMTTWAGLFLVPVWAVYTKGSRSLAQDLKLKFDLWPDLWRGILAGFLMQLVVIPLIYFPLQKLIPDLEEKAEEFSRTLILGYEGYELAIVVIALVLITPVVEELFFRGLLLRALERRFGSTWAIAGSSVVFAVTHINALLAIPALLVLALLLGWFTVRTGRLGAAIIAHALFNGFTVVALLSTT